MPSRKIHFCSGVFVCAAILICVTSPAAAQATIYNINVVPSTVAPMPAQPSAPAVSSPPAMQPAVQMPAPRPSLADYSQPPLLIKPSAPWPQPVIITGTPTTSAPLNAPALAAALAAQDRAIEHGSSAPLPLAPPTVPVSPIPAAAPQYAPAPTLSAASSPSPKQVELSNSSPVAASAPSVASSSAAPLPADKVPAASDAQPETLQTAALTPPPQSNVAAQPVSDSFSPPQPYYPQQAPSLSQQQQQFTPNFAFGPQHMSLATRTGIDIGPEISGYRYHQVGPSATISGMRFGGAATGTLALGQGFFVAADGSYSAGWLDYSGSGDLNSRLDTLWEARGLIGTDFVFQYFSLSPYTGFGYRSLTDHEDGISSTGVHLPLRENELYYIPLGIQPRAPIDERSRVTATLEYDFVFHGLETTHFNDTGNGDPTVRNGIPGGFGFHVGVMYETPYWSIGPFGSFWSIKSSHTSVYNSPGSTCGTTSCSFTEPLNHTLEGGIQFRLHLF